MPPHPLQAARRAPPASSAGTGGAGEPSSFLCRNHAGDREYGAETAPASKHACSGGSAFAANACDSVARRTPGAASTNQSSCAPPGRGRGRRTCARRGIPGARSPSSCACAPRSPPACGACASHHHSMHLSAPSCSPLVWGGWAVLVRGSRHAMQCNGCIRSELAGRCTTPSAPQRLWNLRDASPLLGACISCSVPEQEMQREPHSSCGRAQGSPRAP